MVLKSQLLNNKLILFNSKKKNIFSVIYMYKFLDLFWSIIGYGYVDETKPTMTPMSMAIIPKNKFFNYVLIN